MAREQQRLSAVLQSAADAILMFDEQTCLQLYNPAGQNLFTDFQNKLGKPFAETAGYEPFAQLLQQAKLAGDFTSGDITWPDQRTFSVSITRIKRGRLRGRSARRFQLCQAGSRSRTISLQPPRMT